MLEDNIWVTSVDVYVRNWKWVLGYVGLSGFLAAGALVSASVTILDANSAASSVAENILVE